MTTTFEPIGAPLAPAVVVEPAYELKWKESSKASAEAEVQCSKKKEKEIQFGDEVGAEKSEKANQPPSDRTPELRDFRAGCKIMEHVKKKGILEEILSENDNRLIREFFERGLQSPDEKIMDVLNEALDMCYGRLTTEEQSSLMADRDTSALLQDKERAKSAMLDGILFHPDYNPNAWGGQKPLLNISDKVEKLNEIDQQLPIVEAKSLSKLKEGNESSTQSQASTFDPCEEQPAYFSRVVAVNPVENEALNTAQGEEQVANSAQKSCKETREGQPKASSEKQLDKEKKEKSVEAPKQKEKAESRDIANKKSDDVKEKTAKTFKENEKATVPGKKSEGGGVRKNRSRSSENPKSRSSLKQHSNIEKGKTSERAGAGSKHHAKSRKEAKSKSRERRTSKSRSQSAVSRKSARKS